MAEAPQNLTPGTYLDKMCEKHNGREAGPIPHGDISRCVRADVGGNVYVFGLPDSGERCVEVSVIHGEPLAKGSKTLVELDVHLPHQGKPYVTVHQQACEPPVLEEILRNITPPGLETFKL